MTTRPEQDAKAEADLAAHNALKRGVHGIPGSVGAGAGLVGDGSGGWSVVTPATLDANGRLGATGPVAYGTLAQRNALTIGSLPDGFPFFATDDNGGTLYQAQASVWVKVAPRGIELGYMEKTDADFTTTSTTAVDITGLSVPATVGGRPIVVSFSTGQVKNNTAGAFTVVTLVQGASTTLTQGWAGGAANGTMPMFLRRRLSLTAGSYTFKVQVGVFNASTATVASNANIPASLQVVEV